MDKKQKTLAVAGAGIAAAAALGLTGAALAGATEGSAASTVAGYGYAGDGETGRPGPGPGPGGGMRDAGGTLTADAASKAIAAAAGEVDGGTVSGVRALSTGGYVVDVHTSDGTHVHVLLDAKFAVTSVEEGGMGRGGREMPDPDGDDSTGSTDPSDANRSTSAPTT